MTDFARSRGRPLGEVSLALLSAVRNGGPAPVRELAHRAAVGFDAARFKAKDLVRAGVLVAVNEGRPMVLGLPGPRPDEALVMLSRSFWERDAALDDDPAAGAHTS